MQQRRVRLGDILDDYCPRERRITNHAVVAMIEDEVKQTRCTTCQADHEYKQAKAPPPRRKKPGALGIGSADPVSAASLVSPAFAPSDPPVLDEVSDDQPADTLVPPSDVAVVADAPTPADEDLVRDDDGRDDEWPVHRPLIRATLPRPEGQAPERKEPEFTIRQNGRFDRNGNRNRNRPGRGPGSGQARFNQSGQPHRSGHGAGQHSGQGSRPGNRPPSGQRSGGRSGGQGRGPNSGQGRGRRGR